MIIAGFDIATTTGISIMDGPKLLHAEAFRPKGKSDAEIFHGLRVHLRPLLVSYGVTNVFGEQPLRTDLTRKETQEDGSEVDVPMVTMQTFLRIYGLRGVVMELCHSLNLHYEEVHQGTWRALFLKGMTRGPNIDLKDLAVARCTELGWDVKSKDAAEACGVCFWGGAELETHNGALPGDLFCNIT